MSASAVPSRVGTLPPLPDEQYGKAYDEMFSSRDVARAHYQALQRTLLRLDPEELRRSQQAADLTFLQEGITFTVYGSKEGTERIFPNDLIPRIIPAQRMGSNRARPHATPHRAKSFPARHLPRGPNPDRGHRPPRTDLQLQTFPPRNARASTSRAISTSIFAARIWFACPTAASPFSKTICASPAACPTCWPTAKS